MKRPVIVDFNNFWSPSGGGVRRYHLERMKFYERRDDATLVFVQNDSRTFTEKISDSLIVEHKKAFRFPGNWEYRFLWKQRDIRPLLEKYAPDIVEVGSPYILPKAVSKAAKAVSPDSILTAFWHADFPVTYVRRFFEKWGFSKTAKIAEAAAFAYARSSFENYRKVEASSHEVLNRMEKNGFAENRLEWIPLGVDLKTFRPEARDESLVRELKAGNENRLTLFFPHRFCDEKGLGLFLNAYPILCERLECEPAVLFAGTGPDLPKVEAAAKKFKHIRYEGFIRGTEEMAKRYASTDLSLALSGWETFGLSILESLACGDALVAASTGAAAEHLRASGAGVTLEERTPQALAEAILQISRMDVPKLKRNAVEYAQKFSWKSCFERQLSLYRQLREGKSHD